MPELELKVGGRSYTVACQDGEELHLQSAANTLNAEADHVVSSSDGRLPESRVLLMAGLMLADRMSEVTEQERYAEERIGQLEARVRESEKNAAELKIQLEKQAQSAPGEGSDQATAMLEKVARELEDMADTIEASANA